MGSLGGASGRGEAAHFLVTCLLAGSLTPPTKSETRSEKKKELPPSRREAGSNTTLRSAGSDERYAVRLEWRSEAGSALHAYVCACEVASGAGGASALGAVHGKGLMRGGKEVTL